MMDLTKEFTLEQLYLITRASHSRPAADTFDYDNVFVKYTYMSVLPMHLKNGWCFRCLENIQRLRKGEPLVYAISTKAFFNGRKIEVHWRTVSGEWMPESEFFPTEGNHPV